MEYYYRIQLTKLPPEFKGHVLEHVGLLLKTKTKYMDYQKLFDYMSREHDVTLLEQDMREIVLIVNEMQQQALSQPVVGGSIPSQAELVSETADAYCPNCKSYIVNDRVTYEECCDTCGTEIEWNE